MPAAANTLLQYIRGLVPPPESHGLDDAALLNRFVTQRDETAFAALVVRHGPLVLQVCRRVLGDSQDAEDAFQAAFLVLARKAATVCRPEALPAWLHGVARRAALKARSAKIRRCRDTEPLLAPAADPHSDPLADLSVRELLMILDEELERLPETYRLPLILCGLESRSLEEAARQLGLTVGSVKGRLERGRARLHKRLIRRGLTLSAALAAAEAARGGVSAAVLARLVTSTVRGAIWFAARSTAVGGVTPAAAALAGHTLASMTLAKLKISAALLLATCLLAAGFVIHPVVHAPSNAPPERRGVSPRSKAARLAPLARADNRPARPADEANTLIEVRGHVLDPAGKPLPQASLYLGYSVHRFTGDVEGDVQSRQTSYRLRATSEADGRFHFTFAIAELDARALDDWRPAVIAVADGYGPDWAEIGESGQSGELSLKLVEDLPVSGRILDPNQQPVAGAKVLIQHVMNDPEEGFSRYFRSQIDNWYPRIWRGPLPEQPPAVATDADGRFHLAGLGRNRIVRVALEGASIPNASLHVVTRPREAIPAGFTGASFDYVARPSRSVRGVVRDKATSRPLAGVKVSVQRATTLTDEEGRFEIVGCPKADGYLVGAQPQIGQLYFAASACVKEKGGAEPLVVNFDLVRGILLSGRVTDASRQKPPRAAVVEYYPLFPNSHCNKVTNGCNRAASSANIEPDGSYRLVVLPGPGVVCVAASPRNSYVVAMVDDLELAKYLHHGRNQAGAQALCTEQCGDVPGSLEIDKYNALSLINPEEAGERLALDLAVRPAGTVQGTVMAPDYKPLSGVRVIGLTSAPDDERLESACFSVRGLNPGRARELFFLHSGKSLGKHLTIPGDRAEPLTVRLEPCGRLMGRMVDKRGQPVPGMPVYFRPWDDMAQTDRDGRFHMSLVPKQKYTFFMYRHLLKDVGEFAVESGRTKDLGVLTLEDDRPTGPNEINASRKEVDGR